jgi:TrkA domain protein
MDRRREADIEEHDLPGIGRRYDMADASGRSVQVVLHHSGRRDLYLHGDRGRPTVSTFTDGQARRLGAIISGAYFTPVAAKEVEAVIDDLLIDWVTLGEASPAAGHTIRELEVRRRTRMTIAAILRDGKAEIAPEPDARLQAGDRLVIIGRLPDLPAFVSEMVGEEH